METPSPSQRPVPRRRSGRPLLWLVPGVSALLAVVLVLPFGVVRIQMMRDWILDHSVEDQILAPGQRIRIDEIARLDPGGFDFRGLRVEAWSDSGWNRWFSVERVHATWNTGALLKRRISVGTVYVRSPLLDWTAVPNPVFASRKPGAATARNVLSLPPIRCDSLEVADARVFQAGRAWLEGTLRLENLTHDDGVVAGRLEIGHVRSVRDSLELRVAEGQLRGKLIEEFSVDSLAVLADGLVSRLDATLRTDPSGASQLSLQGTLTIERVDPVAIVPLRRLGLPWGARDDLRGSVLFSGEFEPRQPPHAELVLGLSGEVLGIAIDTLRVLADATPGRAELVDFDVRSGALRIRGDGVWFPQQHAAEGSAEFSSVDLSAPVVARFTDLPSSNLSGRVEGRADSLGARVRVRADLAVAPGVFAGHPLGGFHARVRLDPSAVFLDTLWTGSAEAPTLRARGQLDRGNGQRLRLEGRLQRFPLATWVDPWIAVGLDGPASGPFRLFGTLARPELVADLGVGRLRVVEITADTVHVGPARGTLRPFRIETSVVARGLDFYGFSVDSLRAEGVLADTISTRSVGFCDTTRIELDGRVLAHNPGIAYLDRIHVEPGAAPAVDLAEPSVLGFSSERVWIDSLRVISEAGEASGSAWILPGPNQGGEPFAFSVAGRGLDLGALASYVSLDPDTLNGIANVVFSGAGTVDEPRYRFSVDAETAEVYGWLWQSIRASGRAGEGIGEGSGLAIDTLRATAHGYVGRLPVLGPERVGPEPPGKPVEVAVDAATIRFPRSWANVWEAMVHDSLFAVLEEAELNARIAVESLPAGPILAPLLAPRARQGSHATFAAEPLDPMLAIIRTERPEFEESVAASGMAGTVGLTLEIGGTGASPTVTAQARADHLRIYQARADSVLLSAMYADSMLYLQKLNWREGARGWQASGRIPLRLRADPHRTRLREEPLWIEVEIPSVDLSLASLFTALIEDPSGNLAGRGRLKGTPPNLFLEGDFIVDNGAFRIPLREERLTQVEGRFHLDSLGVHIEQARGRFNESGTAVASGWYRDPTRFDLRGTVRNALVFESGNYNFLADADLTAAPVAVADTTRPRLSGTVSVQEGAITMDLAKPGRQKVLVTPWIFDLDVVLPGNVRVIQPTSSVYVGLGRLQVRYDMPFWSLGGRVDVTSGHILIFNKNLRITSGTVDFLDTGTGPYPVLDVKAATEVPGPDGDNAVQIEVAVSGSPLPEEGLEVSLSSPSHHEYSQEDLIDLLTIGQLRSGSFATGSAADPARGFLTGRMLNSLERELIREAPWLDVVEVSGGTDASDPIVISLRAVTEPQWSLRYSQEIAATSGQEVALTYRISNLFFLNAAADRKRRDPGISNEAYTLDFRLRVDY